LIKLISSKFDVNENWLKTGGGDWHDSEYPEYVPKDIAEVNLRVDALYDRFANTFIYYKSQLQII
jgi:hypothetical protein